VKPPLRSGPSPLLAPGTRRFGLSLAAIVAIGVTVRALQTLLVAPWPPNLFLDEAYYSTLAHLIASGEGFVRPAEFYRDHVSVPTAERAPLFPALVAGLYKLGLSGGDGRLLGLLTGGATITGLGLLGRRLAGPRAGLLAAGVAALYPILIAADGSMMTESTFGAFAAFSMLAAYRLLEAPGAGRAAVLGVLLGLGALARAEALLMLPLLLLPVLRRPAGLKAALVTCVAFAVIVAPWTIRNWSAFDRPVLIATEGGETLAGANCDPAYYGSETGTWVYSCLSFNGRGNEAAELDKAGHKGVRYARDHLGRLPVVIAARLARTWGLWKPFAVPEGRRAWVQRIGVGVYFLLIPLAIYGVVLLRRRRVPLLIVLTPFITVSLIVVLAYGQIRLRHSAELSLVVLAAVALDRLLPGRTSP
jgi:hypothetical protein